MVTLRVWFEGKPKYLDNVKDETTCAEILRVLSHKLPLSSKKVLLLQNCNARLRPIPSHLTYKNFHKQLNSSSPTLEYFLCSSENYLANCCNKSFLPSLKSRQSKRFLSPRTLTAPNVPTFFRSPSPTTSSTVNSHLSISSKFDYLRKILQQLPNSSFSLPSVIADIHENLMQCKSLGEYNFTLREYDALMNRSQDTERRHDELLFLVAYSFKFLHHLHNQDKEDNLIGEDSSISNSSKSEMDVKIEEFKRKIKKVKDEIQDEEEKVGKKPLASFPKEMEEMKKKVLEVDTTLVEEENALYSVEAEITHSQQQIEKFKKQLSMCTSITSHPPNSHRIEHREDKVNTGLDDDNSEGIKAPKCEKCGQAVYKAEERLAGQHSFHKFCFKCDLCNKYLDSTTLGIHGNKIYCKQCYGRMHGPKGYGFGGGAGTLTMDTGKHLGNESEVSMTNRPTDYVPPGLRMNRNTTEDPQP